MYPIPMLGEARFGGPYKPTITNFSSPSAGQAEVSLDHSQIDGRDDLTMYRSTRSGSSTTWSSETSVPAGVTYDSFSTSFEASLYVRYRYAGETVYETAGPIDTSFGGGGGGEDPLGGL